jgi:hypothetical protein
MAGGGGGEEVNRVSKDTPIAKKVGTCISLCRDFSYRSAANDQSNRL